MKTMSFLSDFGLRSTYVAQMKAAAACITDARFIDITHDVSPQDIYEGAFALMTVLPYFPEGTVHVAVVDPGVGTERKGIIIKTENHVLVGPDNGLLLPAARNQDDFTVFEIANTEYMLPVVSHTFHGRDIFAPVAAHIADDVSPEEIGDEISDYVDLDFGSGTIKHDAAEGKIIYVDGFGNLVTNIDGDNFLKRISYGVKVMLSVADYQEIIPFAETYGQTDKEELLVTVGSHGFVELSVNQGDAAQTLDVKRDTPVIITF